MTVHITNPKATYIHIPKTGGQSIKNWIRCLKLPIEQGFEHGTLRSAQQKWNDLGTTFTLVRNPYDRMVSIYFFAQARIKAGHNFLAQQTYDTIQKDKEELCKESFEKGFDWWIHFMYDYADELYINEVFPFFVATRPQVSWFSKQEIDLVIKLENIKTDIQQLKNMFNVSYNLETVNATKHDYYKTYYTPSSKMLVEQMYKQDLEKFNYDY